MRLFRFIGIGEYHKLINREILVNTFDYSEIACTNSKGFCFFTYNRTNDLGRIITNVLDEWGFAGVVSNNYLVEIEAEKPRKAWGWYAGGRKTEYNLTEYSLKNVNAIYEVKRLPTREWRITRDLYITYGAKKVF